MPFNNSPAIIVLSLMLGAAVGLNLVGADSYLLSVTLPVYAIYSTVAAGFGFWLFLEFLNPHRLKFASFSIAILGAYVILLSTLFLLPDPSTIKAGLWVFMAIMSHRIFRWVVSQLIIRHLDPARARSFLSYLTAYYELGMLIGLFGIKFHPSGAQPSELIVAVGILSLLGIVLIAIQFAPASNFEIHFTRTEEEPPEIPKRLFRQIFLTFGLMAGFFGAFNLCEEYLIRIVIQENMTSYDQIRNLITNFRFIGSSIAIVGGLSLGFFVRREHLSPIFVLLSQVILLTAMAVTCWLTQSLYVFVAFDIAKSVGENCFLFLATQMTLASFVAKYRNQLEAKLNLFLDPLSGIPLVLLFSLTHTRIPEYEKGFLIGFGLLLLMGAFITILILRRTLVEAMYEFIHLGHRTASILAVNFLSYLRPKKYEEELQTILDHDPKKLLKKNIILSLGYSKKEVTIDTIIREFNSGSEEIQMSVLDALRVSHRHKAVQFMAKVVMAQVKPRTIRVRINATSLLAGLFGKYSIPFLLNGLDDEDPRIVANTLETLATFRDPSLIAYFEHFLSSPIPRVRANALMGLAAFRSTRELYRTHARELLRGPNDRMRVSILYVIGHLEDRKLKPEVEQICDSAKISDPGVKRVCAWALTRMGDRGGMESFVELLSEDAKDDQKTASILHFFSQLPKTTRMDLIRMAALKYMEDHTGLKNLEKLLDYPTYDFHEELDFFYLLKEKISESDTAELLKAA